MAGNEYKLKTTQVAAVAQQQDVKYDNFYTPNNRVFYDSFNYATLGTSERHIRLLRIHPLEENEDNRATISCDLLDSIALKDVISQFTTVSYCAGNPKKTEIMFVNGLPFNAFANLGHALRQARHFWKTHHGNRELLLWADQVCIDQSDTSERSHQVNFMGNIYAAAEQVLICLTVEGDPTGGVAWLMSLMNKAISNDDGYPNAGLVNFLDQRLTDRTFLTTWNAFIKSVLRSEWFTRAWIRQEFIRSEQAYFMVAFESLQWESLLKGVNMYYQALYYTTGAIRDSNVIESQRVEQPADATTILQKIGSLLLRKRLRQQTIDLVQNLDDLADCMSSDPRDLIYAFLGISSKTYGIIADYSNHNSFDDISCQLACNFVTHYGNLDLLSMAYVRNNYFSWERVDGYPSWVPDWKERPAKTSIGALKSLATPNVSFRFLSDGQGRANRVLQTRGFMYGVLQSHVEDIFMLANQTSITEVRAYGMARLGDEVWILYGSNHAYVFRSFNSTHRLVGEVEFISGEQGKGFSSFDESKMFAKQRILHESRMSAFAETITSMVENDYSSLRTINIA